MKNQKIILAMTLALISFFSILSHAGEWGSSGGEFLTDVQNPWFLKNVTTVRYCIQLDESGFSANRQSIEKLIHISINYWKKEFEKDQTLGIAKQNFIQTAGGCTGAEELQFQFGYNTLSASQLTEFSAHQTNPQNFVAVTVRTDYDRKNLLAKGFIFIGSDRGDHPYNRGVGVATNLWQHEGVLYRVLAHEIGHVFGLPHVSGTLMGWDYPELVLKQYSKYRDIGELSPFFQHPTRYTFCKKFEEGWPLPLPSDAKCLFLHLDAALTELEVEYENGSGEMKLLAKLPIRENRMSLMDFPVKVLFNRDQTLFPVFPGEKHWNGPSRLVSTLYIDLPDTLGSGSLLLDLSPTSLRIHQIKGGKIVIVTEAK